ncbi:MULTISPECIES: fructose-specific PTS transporter subunit EIIC [Vagococcus]|uniref:PTS system, fructose-specific IIA component / PTS system, fructose-specific IIB component / PTS system, fructose-specific IIC component n=1 Tax=Vagococcus fluvialis bH819 TaxID=1255619 RepID=A0A1X6WMW5_9ENTE|nr:MULTISPECIES: fructose-specific PTS transporter subunit EIIC [Vagococcus]SLM85615.1 PTS system, fructose-specific IIA component / PTS system, fructose-specific IIB component / PTS system, fructose-specific IIC component [Vagococcus fluvialis bH819]HCM89583.1 PTS fructose transporter subunit IIC [Vagococcus sp.]
MKVTDLLVADCMIMDLKATDKKSAIKEMVSKLHKAGRISDQEVFEAGIIKREEQTSTGLGDGIAMPHSKNSAVVKPTVLFAKSSRGVDYEALDGQPTFLFFMIAAPEGANDTHLQALAGLSRLLLNPELITSLKKAINSEEVISIFDMAQKEYDKAQAAEEAEIPTETDRPFVIAVTACPTGIAHTYMAEDALKNKAKEMNVEIKVETNGSEGVKHRLTTEDIKRATGVIVAADKNVEMARFEGKHLVNRPVSDGIKKTEELINLALGQEAPIYHHSGNAQGEEQTNSGSGSVGSQIYKHLMNGISHMLPFVIGGGIIIALSFMVDQFMGVPQEELSKLGSYHELAAQLNTIGGAAFGFMLPVLAGFIASSIADRPGLVVGFAAGALANTGGAGFLGALLGGFIAGYVVEFLRKILKGLPKSLDGIKTILFYPLFGVLITGVIMLVVNVPMAAINNGLNNFLNGLSGGNAALLGALLGGMMAIDLGGPVNKAAYVFGTGTLAATVATGGSPMMAAVMAGGMVPPLAIAIATILFKDKFTKKDKDAGLTNLVMGFSFITEGAIPFAASDPLKMIPSFVVGSALTGALVGGAGIKLMAPHGGIFVIMLVNKPLLYLAFILIGSFVSAIVLGLLKKKV